MSRFIFVGITRLLYYLNCLFLHEEFLLKTLRASLYNLRALVVFPILVFPIVKLVAAILPV